MCCCVCVWFFCLLFSNCRIKCIHNCSHTHTLTFYFQFSLASLARCCYCCCSLAQCHQILYERRFWNCFRAIFSLWQESKSWLRSHVHTFLTPAFRSNGITFDRFAICSINILYIIWILGADFSTILWASNGIFQRSTGTMKQFVWDLARVRVQCRGLSGAMVNIRISL